MDKLGPLGLLESEDKNLSQQVRDKLIILQDVILDAAKGSTTMEKRAASVGPGSGARVVLL